MIVLCLNDYHHLLCITFIVFLLGLGSRVLRGAGKGNGKVVQLWVGEPWGQGVHCQLLDRHGRGIVQGHKPKMCIFPFEWP